MTAPGPGSVENTAAILRNICGRTAEGNSSACPHDHMGEAAGLTTQIRIATLRDLLEFRGSLTPDVLRDMADEMEKEITL
jgi:hypothetical protein